MTRILFFESSKTGNTLKWKCTCEPCYWYYYVCTLYLLLKIYHRHNIKYYRLNGNTQVRCDNYKGILWGKASIYTCNYHKITAYKPCKILDFYNHGLTGLKTLRWTGYDLWPYGVVYEMLYIVRSKWVKFDFSIPELHIFCSTATTWIRTDLLKWNKIKLIIL